MKIGTHFSSHGLGVNLVERFLGWQDRLHSRAVFARLDDHALRDIGLSRAEVESLYDKPFWRI